MKGLNYKFSKISTGGGRFSSLKNSCVKTFSFKQAIFSVLILFLILSLVTSFVYPIHTSQSDEISHSNANLLNATINSSTTYYQNGSNFYTLSSSVQHYKCTNSRHSGSNDYTTSSVSGTCYTSTGTSYYSHVVSKQYGSHSCSAEYGNHNAVYVPGQHFGVIDHYEPHYAPSKTNEGIFKYGWYCQYCNSRTDASTWDSGSHSWGECNQRPVWKCKYCGAEKLIGWGAGEYCPEQGEYECSYCGRTSSSSFSGECSSNILDYVCRYCNRTFSSNSTATCTSHVTGYRCSYCGRTSSSSFSGSCSSRPYTTTTNHNHSISKSYVQYTYSNIDTGATATSQSAYSTVTKYTIAFNSNQGTGSMSNQYFLVGHTQALNANTFTRTGYRFIGWSTSSTATTPTYTDGESVSNIRTSSGTTTLYAVWQTLDYTVVFEYSGYPSKIGGLAGGFENTGWSGSYDTVHVRSGSYALKIIGDAGVAEKTVPTINPITINDSNKGHIFYVQYWGYQETRTTGGTQVYWPIVESPMAIEVGVNNTRGLTLGPAGQWNMYSFYDDRLSVQNYSASNCFRIDFDNGGNAGEIWIDDVILLDLTEIFGTGNEPSKEWCDKNIRSGTNTQTITMNTDTALENRQGSDTAAYYFVGWSTTPKTTSTTNQTINYTNGQVVNNIASAGGTITLYGVWQYRPFSRVAATSGGEVRISGNDLGTGSTSTSVTYTAIPYKGYYLTNWAIDGTIYQQNGTTYTDRILTLPRAEVEGKYIVAVFSPSASTAPSANYTLQNNFGINSTIGGEARLIGCLDLNSGTGHSGGSSMIGGIDMESGSTLLLPNGENLAEIKNKRGFCIIEGKSYKQNNLGTSIGELPLVDWNPEVTQDNNTNDSSNLDSTNATAVKLIAVVTEKGHQFDGWYVDDILVSTDLYATLDLSLIKGKIVEARFERISDYNLNDSTDNSGDAFDPSFD